MSVLCVINLLGIRSENIQPGLLEPQRNVLRQLTTDADDDTISGFKLVNVHDSFKAQLFKVESIGLVEIGRHSLRVVVDHNGLLALGSNCSRTGDGTPIEFDTAADSVNTTPENHGSVLVKLDVVLGSVVGGVQVVGVSGEFSSQGVDSLDEGGDLVSLSDLSYFSFGSLGQLGDLLVGESGSLGGHHDVPVNLVQGSLLEGLVDLANVLELVQEPLGDLGQVVNSVNRVVEVQHSVSDGKQSSIVVVGQSVVNVLGLPVGAETIVPGIDLSNSLLQRFFKCSTDGHNFTDRLHSGSDGSLDILELCQIPLGDLGHDVVQGGLEACRGRLGDGVGQLGKSVAEGDLGGGIGQGITGSFRGQGAKRQY